MTVAHRPLTIRVPAHIRDAVTSTSPLSMSQVCRLAIDSATPDRLGKALVQRFQAPTGAYESFNTSINLNPEYRAKVKQMATCAQLSENEVILLAIEALIHKL